MAIVDIYLAVPGTGNADSAKLGGWVGLMGGVGPLGLGLAVSLWPWSSHSDINRRPVCLSDTILTARDRSTPCRY